MPGALARPMADLAGPPWASPTRRRRGCGGGNVIAIFVRVIRLRRSRQSRPPMKTPRRVRRTRRVNSPRCSSRKSEPSCYLCETSKSQQSRREPRLPKRFPRSKQRTRRCRAFSQRAFKARIPCAGSTHAPHRGHSRPPRRQQTSKLFALTWAAPRRQPAQHPQITADLWRTLRPRDKRISL